MRRGRLLPGLILVLSLVLLTLPARGAAPDVGRTAGAVVRLTQDGGVKNGAVISGDGSTVAYFAEGSGYADLLMVVPAAGGTPKVVLQTDTKTDWVVGLKGPGYRADDLNYRIALRNQHIRTSYDGGLILIEAIEYPSSGYRYGWILVNSNTGALTWVAEAYPPGMGTAAVNTYGAATSVGEGYSALSWDGATVLFAATGSAESGKQDIIVALDIATGTARRIAGYTALTAKLIGNADPPGGYTGPWVSPGGTQVAFTAYNNWATQLYVSNFAAGSAAARHVATLKVGSTPMFTQGGEYLVARHPNLGTTTFWPVAGGAAVEIAHPDAFAIPYFDGKPGVVVVPVWANNTQEIVVARAEGMAVVARPGELGLPAGWQFGVKSLSSGYHYTLADSQGTRVLLPMVSADGTKQDLFLLTLQVAATQPPKPPEPPEPPHQPGDGKAIATVTWEAPVPAPTGYLIYRSDANATYDPSWPLTDFPLTETTYTDTGVKPGECYYLIYPLYKGPDGTYKGQYILVKTVARSEKRIILKIDSKNVKVGETITQLDVAPLIQNGRTLVPLRFVGEALGATVGWDGTARMVTYTKGATVIKLWIGKTDALVGSETFVLDVPPQIVDGRTLVPLRFVTRALGAVTEWNGETREVTIVTTE